MPDHEKTELTYAEASAEIERILDEIESGTADVDVLTERVERAADLIRFCRERLAGTQMRVRKVVDELTATTTARGPDRDSAEPRSAEGETSPTLL